ncbi:zinc ABC transporter substrate-binding protein [Carboxylicivirga mesophila]|uniref:Zinc ABC transporter substrate-binding protein n=1 Tax=Carboxylicivirga mesophila TaxID=1166478 RepID=A0ABS5K885_9BACT|nr:zinc ABC transporter substrate-binding protein [Carboxylicivirga mesophila]MBS2210588.1 zinc ABC transporter substrate-binding protein [Carboxylicivirga mesophila]
MIKAILVSLLAIVILTGCQTVKETNQKPIVSVSIAPQKYFIEQLLKDSIDINIMIPQGSDHASYAPSAAQIKKLSGSVAYIKMGHLGFESSWTDKLKAANQTMQWYNLSKNIEIIQGEHHHHDHEPGHICSAGVDPHTWTSPKQVRRIMKNLKNYLTELFPQHKELIALNHEQFLNQLDEMDERLNNLQASNDSLAFMIFHPAYTYLARDYGFEQLTIEFEGKTPSPSRLKATIELARQKHIRTIYIQQEFDQTNAQVIADEIGAETIQVNPLSYDWLKEMDRFISHLEQQ